MMIQAVLGNPNHPEYGVATIPFPIPHDQYAHCMELLRHWRRRRHGQDGLQGGEDRQFLHCPETSGNAHGQWEELNYLAKRLESFDTGEAAQFQAMAHKLELFELEGFHQPGPLRCQQATVITDFSDSAAVGRDHLHEPARRQRKCG